MGYIEAIDNSLQMLLQAEFDAVSKLQTGASARVIYRSYCEFSKVS